MRKISVACHEINNRPVFVFVYESEDTNNKSSILTGNAKHVKDLCKVLIKKREWYMDQTAIQLGLREARALWKNLIKMGFTVLPQQKTT